jgi:hypothetical protein
MLFCFRVIPGIQRPESQIKLRGHILVADQRMLVAMLSNELFLFLR